MNASLNEKLRNVKWGEYRMGDLFYRVDTIKLPYKADDLPSQAVGKYVLPCLTSSFNNQGLNYFAPRAGATILKNVISIPSNSDVYRAYYQPNEFTVLSDAYAICWKSEDHEITANQYLFMVMCINKVTDLPIYSYKNKLGGWNVVKNKYINLPQKNGEIDFDFMESFIAELEAERVAEVSKCLAASGLDNYELTVMEKRAIEEFGKIEWQEFTIGDFYYKVNLKKKKFDKRRDTNTEQTVEFQIPLVNAKHGNNGIMFYGKDTVFDSEEMTIGIVQNGEIATGDVYPQPQRVGVLWDAYLIKAKRHTDTRQTLFFHACSIYKSIKPKFSYEFKATWDRVKKEKIYLPVRFGTPDLASMELLISAIQKLVIKDVVLYADRRVAGDKQVVSRSGS